MIKQKPKLNVSFRTIQRWIKKLGVHLFNLKQINLETLNICVKAGSGKKNKFCQMVSLKNRRRRYAFAMMCMLHEEKFDDKIFIDETTVELRVIYCNNFIIS